MNRSLNALLRFILLTTLVLLSFGVVNGQDGEEADISDDVSAAGPCLRPPKKVWVQLGTFLSEWPTGTATYQFPKMDDYVHGVIMGELGPVVPGDVPNDWQGQSWDDEVIRAASVAARTYGTKWCHKWQFPENRRGLKDGASDQAYRPHRPGFSATVKQHFYDISLETKGVYLTEEGLTLAAPYSGKVIDAQYRRDTGDPTLSASELPAWANVSYMKSVNNPFNIGVDDGVGWSQIPSQGWRKATYGRGAAYPQLLQQYYIGVYLQNSRAAFSESIWNKTDSDCNNTPSPTRTVKIINYDWGTTAPKSGVNANNFCAEWYDDAVEFSTAGWYTFYMTIDDGARLYIDNNLVFDRWVGQSPTLYTVSLYLSAGTHSIRLKYYEGNVTAVARLAWLFGNGLVGDYYNSRIDKTAPPDMPIMKRPDVPVKFDWDLYSPLDTRQDGVPRILEDNFSVRWQGYIYRTFA